MFPQVFRCPEQNFELPATVTTAGMQTLTHYGFNFMVNGGFLASRRPNMNTSNASVAVGISKKQIASRDSEVVAPSATVYNMDTLGSAYLHIINASQWDPVAGTVVNYRHRKSANVGYVDGHGATIDTQVGQQIYGNLLLSKRRGSLAPGFVMWATSAPGG